MIDAPETPTQPRPVLPALRVRAQPTLPVPYLRRAAALKGKSLAVAVTLISLAMANRSPTVVLASADLAKFTVSTDAALDGLTRLAEAGIVRASRRRGRHPVVTLLDENGREMPFDD